MSAIKRKYMVITQIYRTKDYPEKDVLLEETHLFFSNLKDAKCQALPIDGQQKWQKEIP